jgi:hypothetical protein
MAVERIFLPRLNAVHVEIELFHLEKPLAHESFGVKLDMVVNF